MLFETVYFAYFFRKSPHCTYTCQFLKKGSRSWSLLFSYILVLRYLLN